MHSPNAKKLTVNVLFYLNHIRDYFCKNIFVYDNKCQYNKTSNFTRWWNFRNAGWNPKTKVALSPSKKYRLMSFEKGLHGPDPDRKTEHCATVLQIRGSPPDLAKIHSLAQPFITSGSITWVPSVLGELKLDSTGLPRQADHLIGHMPSSTPDPGSRKRNWTPQAMILRGL